MFWNGLNVPLTNTRWQYSVSYIHDYTQTFSFIDSEKINMSHKSIELNLLDPHSKLTVVFIFDSLLIELSGQNVA